MDLSQSKFGHSLTHSLGSGSRDASTMSAKNSPHNQGHDLMASADADGTHVNFDDMVFEEGGGNVGDYDTDFEDEEEEEDDALAELRALPPVYVRDIFYLLQRADSIETKMQEQKAAMENLILNQEAMMCKVLLKMQAETCQQMMQAQIATQQQQQAFLLHQQQAHCDQVVKLMERFRSQSAHQGPPVEAPSDSTPVNGGGQVGGIASGADE